LDLAHHCPPKQTHLYESLQTRDPIKAEGISPRCKTRCFLGGYALPRGPSCRCHNTHENTVSAPALLDKLGLSPGDLETDSPHVADVMDDFMAPKYWEVYPQSRFDDHIAQVRPVESFYNSIEAEAVRLLMQANEIGAETIFNVRK